MDKDELLHIIEQAAKEGWTSLDLSKRGLRKLPFEILKLTGLTKLNLKNNQLIALPPEIKELTNLKELDLMYNQLSILPQEISKLPNLTELDLSFNQFSMFPLEICKLTNLEKIALEDNRLSSLPSEIGELRNLKRLYLGKNLLTMIPPEIGNLTNLARLSLRDNKLTTLPPEISNLTALTRINLRNNKLIMLPPEIVNLIRLTELDLRYNPLLLIPPEISELVDKPSQIITFYLQKEQTKERDKEPVDTLAAKNELKSINLSNKNLTVFPQEIGNQQHLLELDLSNNRLTSLPPEIAELTNLTVLDLRGNQLTELLPEIGNLTNLTTLDLGGNQLTELPQEIGNLIALKNLELESNRLTVLPSAIGKLTNLIRLDLSGNQLSKLPAGIGKLTNLMFLELGGNQLSTLPPEIGGLTNLTRLHLIGNRIAILPKEIENLINLRKLYLRDNQLIIFPQQIVKLTKLASLDLKENQLSILPNEIRKLTRLTSLDLRENPLPISLEILALRNEPQKILNYYFRLQKEPKRPLNEAKVVIVGQGAVGKTSLVKRLLEDKFDPYETKTEGIDIKQWNVNVPSTSAFSPELDEGSGRTEVRLNVWDFGGQEIMHATHQFFLTKRSLYLLVLDSRLEEQENRVEYWLKIIQSFGGDSPIIVVCNKCDEHDLELNWKGLQEKYPTIKAFAKRVSCKTGEGISELRTLIEREVGQLEHIHDELLLTWFAVKTRLEQMEEDYISYSEYQKMCEAENVFDELSQQTLLGFLHDLGIVLSFHGHYILEDTNVLNPEWVTKGIYQILNSNELFQRKGVLERKALDHILDSNEYPRSKHQFIIDMMRKFELCFDFAESTGERFLVPDLLSKEEPYVGEWDDSLAFHYHYDILPGSVISRFIVRMHTYIFKRTYWRNGVVLVSEDGKNRALVKADIEDKKILIYVTGRPETRSTFLAIIRADFRKIHASISKLNVKEVIPLPDHPEVEIDYQDLLKLRERGISTYYYPKADAEINVDQVLDSLEPHSTLRKIEGEEQQAHSYFLSYSWNNSNEADHIELVLQRNQRTVLRDESYIEAGGRVSKSVEAMIQKADSFVALWSEQYDQSTWCPNELEYARNRQAKGQKPSRIVLITLDETEVPIRFIDSLRLSGQDRGRREQAIQRLLKEEAV